MTDWMLDQLIHDGLTEFQVDDWADDLFMLGVCIPMLGESLLRHVHDLYPVALQDADTPLNGE
jgi:hypothetical protein